MIGGSTNGRMFKQLAIASALSLIAVTNGRAAEESYTTPAGAVGKPFPQLRVKYFGEKPAYDGKARIVEFWATWCPPCRESIPHLNKLYQKFKDQGLVVIGITSEEKADVDEFKKEVPIDYTVASDSTGALADKLGIDPIPIAFVVNKKGVVIWQGEPLELGESVIKKALAD